MTVVRICFCLHLRYGWAMFPGPTLTIDLGAIVANWKTLRDAFTGEECAAVVKADAYGLGMVEVAGELAKAGCNTFFVATTDEGVQLRAALPDVRILVFHGVRAGEEFAFVNHRLIPALNSLQQIDRWRPIAADHPHAVSALHIDTAMARMGLQANEFSHLLQTQPDMLEACRVGLIMSHLACASEPDHPANAAQLQLFDTALSLTTEIPASLCNSGGIYLGEDYHYDLARPGCSLYGIAPADPAHNPMQQVARWEAPILMTRTLERAQQVGYGATQTLPKGSVIATVATGYADGYLRTGSGNAVAYAGEHQVPLVGRVTMDMCCFDVSNVPEALRHEGALLTLLGDKPGIRVDDVAQHAGTIGYEVLTRIGPRVARHYTNRLA